MLRESVVRETIQSAIARRFIECMLAGGYLESNVVSQGMRYAEQFVEQAVKAGYLEIVPVGEPPVSKPAPGQ